MTPLTGMKAQIKKYLLSTLPPLPPNQHNLKAHKTLFSKIINPIISNKTINKSTISKSTINNSAINNSAINKSTISKQTIITKINIIFFNKIINKIFLHPTNLSALPPNFILHKATNPLLSPTTIISTTTLTIKATTALFFLPAINQPPPFIFNLLQAFLTKTV